jgi:hypothetical protein
MFRIGTGEICFMSLIKGYCKFLRKSVIRRSAKTRRNARTLLLFTMILTYLPSAVLAQSSCPLLTPVNGTLGYQNFGNRCEGFYVANVSESFQIVSLLQGTIPQDWQRNTVLKVSAGVSISEPINVRAVPLSQQPFYRMDAVLQSSAILDWPVGDILFPSNLKPNNIGVYGWIGSESDKTFIPLRISKAGASPSASSNILIVRAGTDVAGLVWRWAAMRDGQCGEYKPSQPMGERNANVPIRIALNNVSSPSVCVDIQANKKGETRKLRLTLKLRKS